MCHVSRPPLHTQGKKKIGTCMLRPNLAINEHAAIMIVSADEADFNSTVIVITFPADESGPMNNSLSAPIAVVDDQINEAREQQFYIVLTVVAAVNPAAINTTLRNSSLCMIIDNDRKHIYNIAAWGLCGWIKGTVRQKLKQAVLAFQYTLIPACTMSY